MARARADRYGGEKPLRARSGPAAQAASRVKLIFLIVSRAVSLLGLSRREAWWKDGEILMLRHQLAVAGRERPRARAGLTWPGRALLALLAGTLPVGRLAAMRLIVTPGTILRWHRDIVRRRWSRRSCPFRGKVSVSRSTCRAACRRSDLLVVWLEPG